MNATQVSRRRFLRQSCTAAASTLTFPAFVKSADANQKLNVAFIGVGGRGAGNLGTVTSDKDVNVVALCDVNRRNLARQAERFPQARTHEDFRILYEKTDDIDAVVVSTTEHTHAYATLPALKAKKHVYCEKPLTHNVAESRIITKAAKEAGVATQMGIQIHGFPNYRRVVELIQSGAIGKVREVEVWVARAWGYQSAAMAKKHRDIVHVTERPKEAMTPPDYVNWDLWIGPAPYRPFNDVYFPGPKWYRWWDFGNGTMSDLGSHWIDLPFWALELDAPKTIQASGGTFHPEIAPASMTATYQYGARGDLPPVRVRWHQGINRPRFFGTKIPERWRSGCVFWGDDGYLISDYGKHVLMPEDKFKDFERPKAFIPPSPGQHQQWLQACKTGSPTDSDFSYAGPLTEANHLGNVAFRARKKLEWDAEKMVATNCPEADEFITREPRKGWKLEG